MKQIPNLFTLLNLICGCIAIVLILQTGESIVQLDASGASEVFLPEKIAWGALFIFAAAVVDFLDGFLARAFKATSEMGKQLDSLSDVVSFGVAPGMILYQLLRIGFAQAENGLDISILVLLPAFIYSAAAAWRLGKFNVSTDQSDSFIGVPSPAAGLVVASFPLIILHQDQYLDVHTLLINPWILYVIIMVLSYLMVCNRTFLALKFKGYAVQNNLTKYILAGLSIVAIFFFKWLAVPLIFILYLVFSIFSKTPKRIAAQKETLDITD